MTTIEFFLGDQYNKKSRETAEKVLQSLKNSSYIIDVEKEGEYLTKYYINTEQDASFALYNILPFLEDFTFQIKVRNEDWILIRLI